MLLVTAWSAFLIGSATNAYSATGLWLMLPGVLGWFAFQMFAAFATTIAIVTGKNRSFWIGIAVLSSASTVYMMQGYDTGDRTVGRFVSDLVLYKLPDNVSPTKIQRLRQNQLRLIAGLGVFTIATIAGGFTGSICAKNRDEKSG